MPEINLFLLASRKKFRFPSEKGELTVEQLWDIPLTSRSGFSVNNIAIEVNRELRSLEEESFVETSRNPRRDTLKAMLELLKIVISVRQEEAQKASAAAERATKRQKIMEAIEAKEREKLDSVSLDDLRLQLAALRDF
ncbi:hypothetical protein EBR25_14050 [bacterium]|nr:hypothetical protein [bacterium]